MKTRRIVERVIAERVAVIREDPEEQFYTPRGLSRRWFQHEESIRRGVRARRIPSVKVGRRVLIPRQFVEQREREGYFPQATLTSAA